MPGPWITVQNAGAIPGAGTSYDFTICGLSANTIYQYRACMRIAGISYTGETYEISTSSTPVFLPTVCTCNACCVGQNFACGNGCVSADGGASVTARGTAYGISTTPTIVGSHTTDGSGTGIFTSSIAGLTPNTTYHSRAYATNSVGTAYGNEVDFITLNVKAITLCRSLCVGANGSASTTRAYTIMSVPPMISGESYCLTLAIPLGMSSALCSSDSFASVSVGCNGNSAICFVCIKHQLCCLSHVVVPVNYGDTVYIAGQWTCATTLGCGGVNACVCIEAVSPISGAFEISSVCCKDCAYTG